MGLKIGIYTDSSSIFIRPNEPDLPPETLNVFITLATDNSPPSKLHKLELFLTGHESLNFSIGHFEQSITMDMTKEIKEAAGLALRPNSLYTFQTTFPIEHQITGYQRCNYGRSFHRLTAKATCPGFLTTSVTKASKLLWLVPYPKDDNAFLFSQTAQGFSEGLGPILLSVNSAHLTVGGYLRVMLEVPAPAPNIEIVKFQTSVLQQFTLQSRKKETLQETVPEQRLVFLDVPGADVKEGQWIARLPNDHKLRPTSRLRDQPGITVTHALEARIQYKIHAPGQEKMLHTYRMELPLDLPPCCFQFASMNLPAYSKIDPCPVPKMARDAFEGESQELSLSHCVCGDSLEYLLEIEATLAAAHNAGQNFVDRRHLHRDVRRKVEANSELTTGARPMCKPEAYGWERRNSEEELCRLACENEL
ncbi:hypothetical protein OC842_004667 [Tilletia horrida]|uniref:Arrestin-like N-terminal domain-containing protein n=1 Tax=Tilletia horrida TaxID=155126 RepID=A0AAN6GDW3_9BASI|nr:hypothetical protein OC842_004667 [Tilletia horrida]